MGQGEEGGRERYEKRDAREREREAYSKDSEREDYVVGERRTRCAAANSSGVAVNDGASAGGANASSTALRSCSR